MKRSRIPITNPSRVCIAYSQCALFTAAGVNTVSRRKPPRAITGKISDPSGAAVVGATVTAKDADRGTVFTTKTNEDGIYNLPRLPIGRYEVRVEAPGFQTAFTRRLSWS